MIKCSCGFVTASLEGRAPSPTANVPSEATLQEHLGDVPLLLPQREQTSSW